MNVYSYYTPCLGHDLEAELKLLALWRDAWAGLKFEPIILSEYHARSSPYFHEFNNAVRQLPTVNSVDYERACFIRWLALAQVGGGWMMDYDVFPNRFEAFPIMYGPKLGRLQMMQRNCVCPCLVHVTEEFAMKACGEFATGHFGRREINGKPHFSDQYALEDLVADKVDWIEFNDFVLGYGDDGWEKAQAVHFSNSSTSPRGKSPRWKFIPTLLTEARA